MDATKTRLGSEGLQHWLRFLATRVARGLTVLVMVTVGSFLIVRLLPGDPAVRIAGIDASPEQIRNVRTQLHLAEPLAVQFAHYVTDTLNLDLGTSFVTNRPVAVELRPRIMETGKLALTAVIILLIGATTVGIATAALTNGGRRRWLDALFGVVTGVAGASSEIVIGLVLSATLALRLGWLPAGGANGWTSLIMPGLALAIPSGAYVTRIMRAEAMEVLHQDYVRAANGRRVSRRRLYLLHVTPNAITGTLSLSGVLFATLLGGSVAVEAVFNWPGVGTALVQAVQTRDYPMVQGIVIVVGIAVVIVNTIVDVLLAVIDPRRR